jgi:F-type H+-transporting ATPase subunit b
MQEIVRQLGELFLQAVPTVLIILLFYIILRALFFKPLLRVMAERDARTVGAQKAAEQAQAAAAEKVKQYQDALKQARAASTAQVAAAKERIAGEVADARREIEATVAQLSTEIARRIMETPRPGSSPREAR